MLEQSLAGLSPANALTAKVYVLRTRIAVGQAAEVSSELGGASEPDLIAVKAFADYTAGDKQGAVKVAEELATSSTDNTTVQVLAATVLHLEGRSEEALGLLSKHQGSLEAYATTPARRGGGGGSAGVLRGRFFSFLRADRRCQTEWP